MCRFVLCIPVSALPVSGSKGIISARIVRAPLIISAAKINKNWELGMWN